MYDEIEGIKRYDGGIGFIWDLDVILGLLICLDVFCSQAHFFMEGVRRLIFWVCFVKRSSLLN